MEEELRKALPMSLIHLTQTFQAERMMAKISSFRKFGEPTEFAFEPKALIGYRRSSRHAGF